MHNPQMPDEEPQYQVRSRAPDPAALPVRREERLRESEGERDELQISLRDYWRVLVKRRWQVLSVAAAILAATVVFTLLETPLYRSTAVLQIENNTLRVVKTESLEAEVGSSNDFLGTQMELIRSRTIAERTVRELSLVDDPAFERSLQVKNGFTVLWGIVSGRKSKIEDRRPLEAREAAATKAIMTNLTVTPIRNSRLIQISYVSPDAQIAARVTNGLARVYMQSNLDRRIDNTQFARTFLEDRLQQIKQKLEDSERALIEYSQNQRIVNVDEYASIAAKNLSQLSEALATAQSERIHAEARVGQAKEADGTPLESLKSPVLETLRQKLVELQADYQTKRSVYKPDYPEMLQLSRQIKEVETQIAAEKESYRKATEAEFHAGSVNEKLIQKQIDQLRNEVLDLQGRGIQYNILKREADTNRQLYDGLLQRYKEIGVSGDVGANNISVVDNAPVGGRFKPDVLGNLIKGLLGGLVIGALVALLIEMLDDTLKTPEDIERLIRMPVVGIVPKVPPELFDEILADSKSSFNEAYRSLRTALQYSGEFGAPRILMVTSAVAGEGKSTTSAHLARQFAALGQRVLLIDFDLRKPSLHKHFNLENETGLTDVLSGAQDRKQVVRTVGDSTLSVITSGPKPPNPVELLSVDRCAQLIDWAANQFDQVILDCPPLLGLADVPTVARYADGVLVVIEAGATGVGVVRATLKRLEGARARILGTVLVKFDSRNTGYGYGYGYHYADHYYYYSSYGAYGSSKAYGRGSGPYGRRQRLTSD